VPLWDLYVYVFPRPGDDGVPCGLNTATLIVIWRLQCITEILCFSDVVYMPCAAMLRPVVKHITTLVSLSRLASWPHCSCILEIRRWCCVSYLGEKWAVDMCKQSLKMQGQNQVCSSSVTLLVLLYVAWGQVTTSTIVNCYRKPVLWQRPQHVVQHSAAVRSQWQPRMPGTPSHWTSELHCHWPCYGKGSNCLCFMCHFLTTDNWLLSDLAILYSACVTVLNCDSITLISSLVIIVVMRLRRMTVSQLSTCWPA